MAPLQCASVSDLYGSNFGLSPEQIAQKTLKNNQECAEKNAKYQQGLKENQIAGKANFQENGNSNLPLHVAPTSENNSQFARRPAWTNINNTFPSNQGVSMFNRFQNTLQNTFGARENFGAPATDSDCLRQIVSIAHNIELILKIIMFILILLFIIKLLEKKNA
jgi:hypothetical protein